MAPATGNAQGPRVSGLGVFRRCFGRELGDEQQLGMGSHDDGLQRRPFGDALYPKLQGETAKMTRPSEPRGASANSPRVLKQCNNILMKASIGAKSLIKLQKRQQERWEELEDDLFILLQGNLKHLDLFHKLHQDNGIRDTLLLQSLAYLSGDPSSSDETFYYESVSAVAAFLGVGRSRRELKQDVLRTLITCLSPTEASWQKRDAIVEDTLAFIICRAQRDWMLPEHSETMLIWELRALSIRLLELQEVRVAQLVNTADTAAILISAGAKLVEEGLNRSATVVSKQIENAGCFVKGSVEPNEYPLLTDRDAVVAITYSSALRRASVGARNCTTMAFEKLCDTSESGLKRISACLENEEFAHCLPPEGKEALRAMGKIGLATVGAMGIIGESMVKSSRGVVEKTVSTAADLVGHKYGTSAGTVANDATEATSNVLRTVGQVAAMNGGSKVSQATFKVKAKEEVAKNSEKAMETVRVIQSEASAMLKKTTIGEANVSFLRNRLMPNSRVGPDDTT